MPLPHITQQQQRILILLYRFRFLNRLHIQKFLHHKDKKTINVWLKDLKEKEYICRIYDDETFGENTKLAVYYIDIQGISFLKTQSTFELQVIPKLHLQ